MAISSRFAVGVHILTLLGKAGPHKPVTSDWIASSASTNPAVIRRLLGMLAKAGLTSSQLGAGGGALLARDPADITLLDVYQAVEDGELFALHHEAPNDRCQVGRHIQTAIEECTQRACSALQAELRASTIADIIARVHACGAPCPEEVPS